MGNGIKSESFFSQNNTNLKELEEIEKELEGKKIEWFSQILEILKKQNICLNNMEKDISEIKEHIIINI